MDTGSIKGKKAVMSSQFKHGARLILCMLLLLLAVGSVAAQTEEFTGYMGDTVPDDEYPFDLSAGQTLYAVLVATSGDLDPILRLADPSGDIVAENDDRGDGTLNSEIAFTAEVDGEYTVIVTNFRNTGGDYQLTVEIGGAGGGGGGDSAEQPAEPGTVTEYTGFMSFELADIPYEIDLAAGQTIIVEAEATSGDLDTIIWLEDPSGARVAENDDRASGNLNSRFEYTATETGTYTVVMSNYGKTGGDFVLRIEVVEGGGGGDTGSEAPAPEVIDADETYTGFVDDTTRDTYTIALEANQGVIVRADATDDSLDTLLILENAAGDEVALNDDRDSDDLNSTLIYVAPVAGQYTIVMTNYSGTRGDYVLTVEYVGADEAFTLLDASREQLSGPMLTLDTEHFRIHYTTEGTDATTEEFARQVAETMEEVRAIQIDQLGWSAPVRDGIVGGDDRFDVYLIELLDNPERGELGSASPEFPIGDNPGTSAVEPGASASYLTLDDDYAEADGDPIALMRATAAHEHHHAVQFGYEANEPHFWYYEATASWMETITVPQDQDATGYVQEVYNYPEVCFGVHGEADPAGGLLKYGSWLFIQALEDWYGVQAPIQLWENIALMDGWEPLEVLLADNGETLPGALASYHVKNLVRDYAFAPQFEDYTVWLENTIDAEGTWTFTGSGIQELAANYYEVALEPGLYAAELSGDADDSLMLYAVGISGTKAEVIALDRGASFDTTGYELTYLMVFNPNYDEDVAECDYQSYEIDVRTSTNLPQAVLYTLDATYFAPPGNN